MSRIIIKKSILKNLIKESIDNIMKSVNDRPTNDRIVDYVKLFGRKGKLPSNDVPLSQYYKPCIKKAYEMIRMNEPNSEVSYNGLPWFDREMRVNVLQNFTINKRGLIYVEREIEVSNNLDNLNFKSLGECWSFSRHSSRSYASNYGIMDNSTVKITLCGYVHPSSINWTATCYVNGWELNNEKEIRMSDDAVVELNYILINGNRQNIGGSYLVNASADRYKDKFEE